MVNSADFVKRLEKILDYYGITATAFAEKIDFNRSTISHLLSGRNKPSLEFVLKLLQKFPEVELNWLLFGKGSFPIISESKPVEVPTKQEFPNSEVNSPDLFSETTNSERQKNNSEQEKVIQMNKNGKEIEKIVIFYQDSSFNVYQN
ncbi:plasmid maintenance system antidote protein [Aequorivita sublithincola DSM 14238]|uniref:Plasmid maintenance system antidote protein n=1 Tax=Aequorivita sublithincola (strain DSM 14238 / LMG 21431 / ACAM 643 / 9-3) TaxID=746697 RepID=I3YYL9_AEQSU|nr:helix-turn-helix transcriptional regulator [Aequorivita sublithincola]AFL82087.1 plasmid maintenance system antidote protein [Aequorivita sublithincola DSM 14238]